jgi:hypothetical protein
VNINEALKLIDEGWVRKPKGFRVHFQKKINSEWVTEYAPGEEEKPLDSDVVAWRLAWKLFQATKSDNSEISEGDIVNIYVVDDLGNQFRFYGTNELTILNAYETQ